ncbi:LysR family transcriptional regulator [uncultured Enterococcus sp.]|uniref:LysR family transcriptional regulator n=1 Tax=uncultured Enterococcus sp. TaxID=167972 RepID=UPI0026023B73|nr:LysR family transcriptional regulator [uncultured Enterococcus sp.]
MIEIYLLKQLIALADYKTLSEAAKNIHLTQPTLSRSMQKLESQIGVPLFDRNNKKITLNDNGELAVHYARQIIDLEVKMKEAIHRLEQSKHILSIGSLAPAPIKEFIPILASHYTNKTIQSEIRDEETLIAGLYDERYQMIVLNKPLDNENCDCLKTFSEQLYYCFSPNETTITKDGVYFAEINGQSMLMLSEVGFWREIVKENMPDSTIIEQTTNEQINFIIEHSSFASFNTDVGIRKKVSRPNRIEVPILDSQASTNYYCISLKKSAAGQMIMNQLSQHYASHT